MAMNISCKFEKASYNIFFVRAVTVKSLYTLRRRQRNEVKSIVSTGCWRLGAIKVLLDYILGQSHGFCSLAHNFCDLCLSYSLCEYSSFLVPI